MKQILTLVFALALTLGMFSTSVRGIAYAQANTTSGNVTAQVTPQGTSLKSSSNNTASTNETGTTSGNVTAQVTPQGTSLKSSNASSAKGNATGKG